MLNFTRFKYLLSVFGVTFVYQIGAQVPSVTPAPTDTQTKINGTLSYHSAYNKGISAYAQPINNYLSGSLQLKIGSFSLPVYGNYSDRKFQYSLPYKYNYVSVAPRYKWIQSQIGTSFMAFSPYSLNGHQYTGVGLNINPGKWQIKAMTGRLFKANETTDSLKYQANYQRMASGAKVKYNGNIMRLGFSLFQAKDDVNSILKSKFKPQAKENVILGTEFGINFTKKLSLNIDYSSMGLVQSISLKSTQSTVNKAFVSKFLDKNPSLQTANALKTTLNYQAPENNTLVALQYERVDPNYQSLGSYYFVNDYENFSLQLSQVMLQQRMFFTGTLGLQRDDLKYQMSSSQNRVVAAANVTLSPGPKFNMGLSYSNFTSYSTLRSVFDEIKRNNPLELLDTLNYRQITQNISTNMNIELAKNEKESHYLSTFLSWMQSANQQGDIVRMGGLSSFSNASISYAFQQPATYFGLSLGANVNINTIERNDSKSIGPIFSLRKGFFKNKWQHQLHLAQIYTDDAVLDKIEKFSNIRYQFAIKAGKLQQINYQLGYTKGKTALAQNREYVSMLLGYNLRF